jgi:hypothetical protein
VSGVATPSPGWRTYGPVGFGASEAPGPIALGRIRIATPTSRGPQAARRVMQPRLDRSRRDPDPVRDRVDRQVVPEAKDEHDPLVRLEGLERSAHRVPVMDAVSEVGAAGRAGGRDLNRRHLCDGTTSSKAESVPTGVHHDPAEPGLESVTIAQAVVGAPGGEGRVGDHVLGLHRIAENDRGEAIGSVHLRRHAVGKVLRTGRHAVVRDRGRQGGWPSIHLILDLTTGRPRTFTQPHPSLPGHADLRERSSAEGVAQRPTWRSLRASGTNSTDGGDHDPIVLHGVNDRQIDIVGRPFPTVDEIVVLAPRFAPPRGASRRLRRPAGAKHTRSVSRDEPPHLVLSATIPPAARRRLAGKGHVRGKRRERRDRG